MRRLPVPSLPSMPGAAWRGAARALVCLVAAANVVPDAGAVFTSASVGGSYGITLQVGSASLIDEVVFNVAGNIVGSGTAVTGTNSTTGSPGVVIQVTPTRQLFTTPNVRLTVDSSIALTCQTASSCGTTNIPFTSIRWTSTDATSPNDGDIQNGTFAGTAAQQLAYFEAYRGLLTVNRMSNTLTFDYLNNTVYPAGTYRGTVRFTATIL